MKIGVIIPAGGSGQRAQTSQPKQFIPLAGKILIDYSIETFLKHPLVRNISLVVPAEYLTSTTERWKNYPQIKVCEGGKDRWQSVYKGFQNLPPYTEGVLIHDAARPFIPAEVLDRCLEALSRMESVVTGLPLADTIKEVQGTQVVQTLDRQKLIGVQTPQAFPYSILTKLYEKLEMGQVPANQLMTDEAGLLESMSIQVGWVLGSPLLHKITRPEDFLWAEALCKLNGGVH